MRGRKTCPGNAGGTAPLNIAMGGVHEPTVVGVLCQCLVVATLMERAELRQCHMHKFPRCIRPCEDDQVGHLSQSVAKRAC